MHGLALHTRGSSMSDGTNALVTVNGKRLWDSLMELARIGATQKGGVCRLAVSDLDDASTGVDDVG